MSAVSNSQLLRNILRELQHVSRGKSVKNHPMYAYVTEQFRRYDVTEKKYCRGEHEVRHMGQTYLCLLESVRKSGEIAAHYRGKEKTTEEAAGLVGLSLPLLPEIPKE